MENQNTFNEQLKTYFNNEVIEVLKESKIKFLGTKKKGFQKNYLISHNNTQKTVTITKRTLDSQTVFKIEVN